MAMSFDKINIIEEIITKKKQRLNNYEQKLLAEYKKHHIDKIKFHREKLTQAYDYETYLTEIDKYI